MVIYMRIKKRHIFFIIIFIAILAFVYVVVSAFSFNTLNFKPFYSSKEYVVKDENKYNYVLDSNNDILFVQEEVNEISNNDGKKVTYSYEVNKILKDNIAPSNIVTFKFDDKIKYEFFTKGDFAYFFYNNGKYVNVINLKDKSYYNYQNLPEGIASVNEFDNNIYIYNDNSLYKIDRLENGFNQTLYYNINKNIKDIKRVDFVDKNVIVCATYDADIYMIDINTNNHKMISKKYLDYYVYNQSVYYTFSHDDKKLGIGHLNLNEEIIFSVKNCDYEKMLVVDDYMYLISSYEINKVSIPRQKRHERLQISTYQYMSFSLVDVIIVNEKLMYLPMFKEFDNYSLDETKYSYHLYRYKK